MALIRNTLFTQPPTSTALPKTEMPLPQPPSHPMPPYEPFAPNPFLRCAMPQVAVVNPDNLKQFYRFGSAQQRYNPI